MEVTTIIILYSFALGITIFSNISVITRDDDLNEIEPIPINNHNLSR
mgnify:CR=1 FL=1|jgi:hypothetical protein